MATANNKLQQPSVGRIVHYQSYGTPRGEYHSEARAAIVTAVHDDGFRNALVETLDVSLCILNPTGIFFTQNVPYSESPRTGCWSWPPKV